MLLDAVRPKSPDVHEKLVIRAPSRLSSELERQLKRMRSRSGTDLAPSQTALRMVSSTVESSIRSKVLTRILSCRDTMYECCREEACLLAPSQLEEDVMV